MVNEKGRGNPVRAAIENLIGAGDLRGLLYKAGELHGHLCSYLAYGVNAGYIAMRDFGKTAVIVDTIKMDGSGIYFEEEKWLQDVYKSRGARDEE